ASYLLREAAGEYRAFWTPGLGGAGEHAATAFGQTDLALPLVEALKWRPGLVVIGSHGYEKAPARPRHQVVRAYRARVPNARDVSIVHMNPVFDSESFAPKRLGSELPTVGIRDAEDLLTMLGFARFAEGTAPLDELEGYLATRVAEFLKPIEVRR